MVIWIEELQQIDRWFIWIDINKDEKYLERMIFGNTYHLDRLNSLTIRNIFYNIDDFNYCKDIIFNRDIKLALLNIRNVNESIRNICICVAMSKGKYECFIKEWNIKGK